MRSKTPCYKVGCPNLVEKGQTYCDAHAHLKKQWKQNYDDKRQSAAKRGYDRRWQKVRKIKLITDPLCEHCGAVATEVDHITPLKRGGDNSMDNLQSLCKPCHSRKTIAEDGGFKQ